MLDGLLCLRLPHGAGDAGGDHADPTLDLAGLAANPPQSAVFDRPDEGIGYRIGKVKKRAFDEIKVFRAKGLERRADNLPPADQPTIVL